MKKAIKKSIKKEKVSNVPIVRVGRGANCKKCEEVHIKLCEAGLVFDSDEEMYDSEDVYDDTDMDEEKKGSGVPQLELPMPPAGRFVGGPDSVNPEYKKKKAGSGVPHLRPPPKNWGKVGSGGGKGDLKKSLSKKRLFSKIDELLKLKPMHRGTGVTKKSAARKRIRGKGDGQPDSLYPGHNYDAAVL